MPGNHDWYSGLNGFMIRVCGVKASERSLGRNWIFRRLWRKVARAKLEVLEKNLFGRTSFAFIVALSVTFTAFVITIKPAHGTHDAKRRPLTPGP